MPRKPSSVFVIAATPNQTTSVAGMPPSQHTAWRIPLDDDETPEDVVRRFYAEHPFGTTFYVVEDTKVEAWVISLELDQIDDARLKEDEDDPQAGPNPVGPS